MSNIRPLPPPPSDMPPPTSPTLALDPIQNSLFEDSPPGPGTAGAEEESQDIEAPKKRRSQRRAEGEETEENSQGPAARNSKPNTRGATSSKRNKKKNLDPNPTLPSFDDQPDPLSQSQTFMPELVVVPSDPHGYMAMCGLTPLTPGMSTIEDRARIAENEVKVAGFVASMVGRINKLQNEVIPKVSNTSSKAAAALDGRLSGQISKVEGSVNVLRDEMGLAKDQNDLALAQLSKDVHAKVDEGHADMLRWRDQKNEVITNFSHRLNALTAANETRRASNAIVGSGSAVALSPLAGDLSNNQAASSSHAMPARSQASSNRYAPYPRSANRAPPADEEVCVLYGPHPTLPDNSGNPLHPLRSIINALDLPTARGSDVRSVYKSSPSANTFVVTFVGRRQAEEFESKINSLSRDGRAPYHGATAKLM
ncbi:hypothetical protein DFP72DRAFT_901678 [Ephemerocybe angulata]|uniref:Uncharacterized protein n=1 Tax=Ephemerocybe angulata TaxID=980116 RepID=A0A8H6M2S5_9AGAR|nr:hypothetical protein DFP72DRAFT_901678 [Tulosesus angulatus]